MPRYDARRIEAKWQAYWEHHQTFELPSGTIPAPGQKLYVLDMFPYPSGDGLHVGHPEGYTATDIVCRYSRMRGKQVLHPMGWDAFGLPAEQHAIKTGTHPRVTTYKNISTFRRQLKMLGFSYDWKREVATTDPEYFRWTQWIFLELFDSWYDPDHTWTDQCGQQRTGKGRPIAELPIPAEVQSQGAEAVRRYQDKHRLAYQHEAPVNWCPALGTVLANEEVIDGKSERGSHPVVRIPLRQWMLRITSYADRLGTELDDLAWPDSIKQLQRNWIGRSEGAEVDFFIGAEERWEQWKAGREQTGWPADPDRDVLRIYTTRPDTLFGATYMVIAPEHPAVATLTTPSQQAAVDEYCRKAAFKSDLDRTDLAKDKTGVFTGSYAINPVNGAKVPVWVADYVLISYGTGAIMAVPAHDLRDWEFAVKYQLDIIPVVQPPAAYEPSREELVLAVDDGAGGKKYPMTALGTAINSGAFDGTPTAEFKAKITAELATQGVGKKAVNYRLRDWLFSRQHFWGEPFPIWHELGDDGLPNGLMQTVAYEQLPVTLPDMTHFKPHGRPEPPLAEAPPEWLYKEEGGKKYVRETNSMPQWAGSCWYYLRFVDPKNSTCFVDPALEKAWMPVDLYVGGAEHAVLHLLYARFWHKVLFDRGHVSTPEPFGRLVNQGMILGEAELTGYQDEQGQWVTAKLVTEGPEGGPEHLHKETKAALKAIKLSTEEIRKQGDAFVLITHPEIAVDSRTYKMSKSRGNVVNPDHVVAEYGADALRLYEMFMGPLEATKPWNMSGVEGIARFLSRVWRLVADEKAEEVQISAAVQDIPPTAAQLRVLHKTIQAVTEDIEALGFNTAISRMMEFVNEFSSLEVRPKSILEPFILLVSPLAPHLAEELWHLLGHTQTLAYEPWPTFDPALLVESEVEIPVQVNGKLRGRIKLPTGADQATATAAATADPNVAQHLTDKTIVKTIFVADKMLNFVVK